ncbi:hypothetical protein SARC_02234 [Sphaeroforma arctica JP610]|uniref:DUF1304 domain-containing protein n=1 Tax=Sphaeroforma arctica JP610 TaxID=667725 RepID=A0A0L0G9N9_9EUKA|nr:hypothetical protein SARC_02234 [Sphaeroforma arctica JP610]KNC85576.1 hypothetical protein SARC_02234 [Sphaeroforma arctica JP610]|eukprot:XP_014159478.1 hypothetical protein SARC_02234 [Sphaeroforma arctica JP610]
MISTLAKGVVFSVATLHVYILALEMFMWDQPRAMKAFGVRKTPENIEFQRKTYTMAKNQGLYNGFLAAGLYRGLYLGDTDTGTDYKFFFLSCVAVAGVYGAATVFPKILMVQTVPALTGIALLYFSL